MSLGRVSPRRVALGRVLWVTAEPPDHDRGGGAIRQAHLLAGLARAAERVDLLVAGEVADPRVRALVADVRERPVAARRRFRSSSSGSVTARRWRDLWRVGVARVPAEVADRRHERAVLASELRRLRRDRGPAAYDVVHVEHLGLAGIVPPDLGRIRSLGVQNVPSRMARQARAHAPGGRQRWLLAAEAGAAERFERRARGASDVVAVVSAADAADLGGERVPRFRSSPSPTVLITPNGVDPDRFTPTPPPEAHRLVFTGTLDYLPNVDGIEWFVRVVLPLVLERVPSAELAIVGRRPVAAVRELAGLPSVMVHADVPAVGPYLERARVAVVPVRIGTGSRVKALEAMAAGRAVVATTIGLEGLDLVAGTEALVADSPAELADAVVRCLVEPSTAARVGAAGRARVERSYRWSVIADGFAAGLVAAAGAVDAQPS